MRPTRAAFLALAGSSWILGADVAHAAVTGAVNQPAETAPATSARENAQTAAAIEAIRVHLGAVDAALASLESKVAKEGESSTAIVEALRALKSDIAALREAASKPPVTTTAPAPAIDPETKRAQERILARLGTLESLLKGDGGGDGAAFGYPRLAVVLSGLAAVLALGSIVSLVWLRPRPGGSTAGSIERRLNELKETLARLAPPSANTKDAKTTPTGDADAAAIQAGAQALRAAAEQSSRHTKAVGSVVEQLQSLGNGLQPTLETLTAQLRELEERRAALVEEQEKWNRNREEHSAAEAARQHAAAAAFDATATLKSDLDKATGQLAQYDRFWPEPLRDGGPLAVARERLVAAVVSGRPEAVALTSALLHWNAVRSLPQRDREQWIDAAHKAGRTCLAYLATEPETPESLEQTQAWTRIFKSALEEAFPSLKLNAVYPGDRFDSDRMEAVSSIAGGRQTVRQAVSWAVLEKTTDATRVLRRAEVITA